MAELASVSLAHDLKLFGSRVFDLTARLEAALAEPLRRAVALAPRRLARHQAASDGRVARRELLCVFKALSEAVSTLDRVPRTEEALAVEASALAQEGAELCEQVYDLIS
jgi:hypothetical protein